jgi:hypothetical protein
MTTPKSRRCSIGTDFPWIMIYMFVTQIWINTNSNDKNNTKNNTKQRQTASSQENCNNNSNAMICCDICLIVSDHLALFFIQWE